MPPPFLDGTPTPPRRGLLGRLPWAVRLVPGAAITRAQVTPWADAWLAANRLDWDRPGPLWVVLGDSTAQGIGASAYDRGYVGQVRALLDKASGARWRVLNLSRSGDRAADLIHNQLPVVAALPAPPDLVSCIVGANDLYKTPMFLLRRSFATISAALPEGGVIGTLPQGLAARRAREINRAIVTLAAQHGLRVADIWGASGPPWRGTVAVDQFHPNDRGYAMWANAVAAAVGLPGRVAVRGAALAPDPAGDPEEGSSRPAR